MMMSESLSAVNQPLPIDCSAAEVYSQHSYGSNYSDSCGESGGDCSSNPPESPLGPNNQSSNSGAHVPPSYQLAAAAKGRQNVHVKFQHQPYNHVQEESCAPKPQQQRAAHPSELPFPDCCFHRSLAERLEFIQAPAVESSGAATLIGPCYRLFIGQLRFETSAAEVRWLVQYLTGITALKVELRGMGCCMAYFRTEREVKTVCQLRNRVLFDHTGVWFAREVDQMDYLQAYVGYQVSQIHRGFRLPKDMMVLEEEKFQPFQPRRGQNGKRAAQQHFQPTSRNHHQEYQQQQQQAPVDTLQYNYQQQYYAQPSSAAEQYPSGQQLW